MAEAYYRDNIVDYYRNPTAAKTPIASAKAGIMRGGDRQASAAGLRLFNTMLTLD